MRNTTSSRAQSTVQYSAVRSQAGLMRATRCSYSSTLFTNDTCITLFVLVLDSYESQSQFQNMKRRTISVSSHMLSSGRKIMSPDGMHLLASVDRQN